MIAEMNSEGDPYEDVAVIYTIFHCESCGEVYSPDMDKMGSENVYKIMGEKAKERGWFVDYSEDDYIVLCSSCKKSDR